MNMYEVPVGSTSEPLETRLACSQRYRDIRQGLEQARTLTHYTRK